MELAFARTLHKFQGQQCGPNEDIKCIIGDPGDEYFENLNPGTFYTLISRITTLGDNDSKDSAIYFTGKNITFNRMMNLTKTMDGRIKEKVQMRNAWIEDLQKNELSNDIPNETKQNIIEWFCNTSIDIDTFDRCLTFHLQCK